MPALPPVDNVSRVVLNWLWNSERCANVVHYLNTTLVGGPSAADIAPDIITAWTATARPQTTNTCSLTSISVTPLDANPPPTLEYTTGLPLLGTFVGESMPNNVAIVTTFRTALRGRSFRGRAFNVGAAESNVNGNNAGGGYVAALTSFWETVRIIEPSAGEATFQLCIVSYQANLAPRPVPLATLVTSVTTNPTVDSMRSRLPGR